MKYTLSIPWFKLDDEIDERVKHSNSNTTEQTKNMLFNYQPSDSEKINYRECYALPFMCSDLILLLTIKCRELARCDVENLSVEWIVFKAYFVLDFL